MAGFNFFSNNSTTQEDDFRPKVLEAAIINTPTTGFNTNQIDNNTGVMQNNEPQAGYEQYGTFTEGPPLNLVSNPGGFDCSFRGERLDLGG